MIDNNIVFGSPVTTMAILSRIETSRADEIHLRYGAAAVQGPVVEALHAVEAPERQPVGELVAV